MYGHLVCPVLRWGGGPGCGFRLVRCGAWGVVGGLLGVVCGVSGAVVVCGVLCGVWCSNPKHNRASATLFWWGGGLNFDQIMNGFAFQPGVRMLI